MSNEFSRRELEITVTEEMTLAESSRPDDPVVESDRGWRPNPTAVKAYEARLLTLRGALEAVESDLPTNGVDGHGSVLRRVAE